MSFNMPSGIGFNSYITAGRAGSTHRPFFINTKHFSRHSRLRLCGVLLPGRPGSEIARESIARFLKDGFSRVTKRKKEPDMNGLTLRTKFLGGFAALLCMVAAVTFTSMRAVSTLNNALDRVAQRMSRRADRTSQLVETVVEISGRQQALLLHSILSDTAGVEQNSPAGPDLHAGMD